MGRARWKVISFSRFFFKKSLYERPFFFTRVRSSIISTIFLNKRCTVYNGKQFIHLFISEQKLFKKFGEFIYTKKTGRQSQKKKNTTNR